MKVKFIEPLRECDTASWKSAGAGYIPPTM